MAQPTDQKPVFLDGLEKDKFYSFRLVHTPNLGRQVAQWCTAILLLLALGTFLPWTKNIRSTGS